MKKIRIGTLALLIMITLLMAWVTVTYAQDMRQSQLAAQAAEEELAEKAADEKKAAQAEAAAQRAAIAKDRQTLQHALAELESRQQQLTGEVEQLNADMDQLTAQEEKLTAQLAETDGMIRELVGVIRIHAKDIADVIEENPQNIVNTVDTSFLQEIAQQSAFPGMADIRDMVDALRATTQSSGEVWVRQGDIVDRSGATTTADILMVGCFTAAYRQGSEVGFLTFTPGGSHLYALSRLPSSKIRKAIANYMAGTAEAIPMDISRGGALRQLTHALSLWRMIPNGGPIVWPILAIFAVGLVLIIERVIFLWRKRTDGSQLIQRITTWAMEKRWEACEKACRLQPNKPVARVVAAGLACRSMQREEMENALQEAILREVPAMERFLATLGMLAAIAPLLGLLGTVTGMIDTFHVITQHGTGDPRMMSGGISEALVTTMLGLAVAIPIMLAHTLINRSIDNQVAQMEEKAVALVNIVHKSEMESYHVDHPAN